MLTQSLQDLYEEDFVLWIDQTAETIRQRDIKNLDWENLLTEIEALGREQRNKVESYLIPIIKHLLLYQYWHSEKDYCRQGWAEEIDNFRIELEILLRSKTLYNHGVSILERSYEKAKRSALRKTGFPPKTFPDQCPYSFAEIINFEFLPDSVD